MKRKILLIIMLLFLSIINIDAKTITDFACNYHIQWFDPAGSTQQPGTFNPSKDTTVDAGYFQIMLTGYNNGEVKQKKVGKNIFYYSDRSLYDSSSPTETIKVGKSTKTKTNDRTIKFFSGSDFQDYIDSFKADKRCPTVYASADPFDKTLYIVINQYEFSADRVYATRLEPLITLVKDSTGENKWMSVENFYSEPTEPSNPTEPSDPSKPDPEPEPTVTLKDPLVCNYNVVPEGEYYDTGINASGTKKTIKVTLKTTFDPETGKPASYKIDVNDNARQNNPFHDLSEEQHVLFDIQEGTSSNGIAEMKSYALYIDTEQLKIVFNGSSCVEGSKIRVYLDQRVEGSTVNGYRLTTDAAEVEKFIEDVDKDHDNSGGSPNKGWGRKPSTPTPDFPEPKSCNEIMGENLITVIKVGISAMQIVGAVLAIVYGMILLVPAVMSKDTDGLKQAQKKLVIMGIVLLCIFMLRYFIWLIGKIFDFDTTCIL